MMRDLWSVLPDDRPITCLCIVEDPNKKPPGYHAVHRTYDQDTDADLWKEGFFGKKITRYLCHSKTEGQVGYLVDEIAVVNDKDLPPQGYTALTHTTDTQQKATKKRIICYKTSPSDKATQAITDIIILSKSKKAPPGFTLAGDMNGHLICFKATAVPKGTAIPLPVPNSTGPGSPVRYASHYSNSPARTVPNSVPNPPPSNLPYPMGPIAPNSGPVPVPTPLYPVEQLQSVNNCNPAAARNYTLPKNMGYGRTWHPSHNQYAVPNRQLSQPYANASSNRNSQRQNSFTAVTSTNLDGITFELNQKFKDLKTLSNFVIPNVDKKTAEQLDTEYNYNFALERQALSRLSAQNQ